MMMMKLKSTFRITVILLLISLWSCDDLLDIEAENSLSGDIYTSDDNFESALNGAYVNFGGIYDGADGGELFGGDFQIMATLLSRNINTLFFWRASEAPNYQDFMDKDVLQKNLRVEANWRRAYETLNIVNGIIVNIDKVESASLKSKIHGEALAIRGILYFEMVRFWAPQYRASTLATPAIPLLTKPVDDVKDLKAPSRATVKQIYDQSTSDLKSALGLLSQNQGTEKTRINVNTCNAFLARIAMQRNDFSDAVGYLNKVIDGSGFSLNDSYMDAFNNTSTTSEDVFAISQNAISSTGNAATRTGLVAHLASLKGVGIAALNINYSILGRKIENSPRYSSSDKRYVLQDELSTVSSVGDVKNTTAYYNDPINTQQVTTAKYLRSDTNIPIIRLSEMLLSRAEATLENGGFTSPVTGSALSDLNAVRTRAGLSALQDTLSADAFYDSLVLERNREFLFEGVYFHDLKRWAANGRRTTFTISLQSPLSNKFILPIPQSECDASPGLCD